MSIYLFIYLFTIYPFCSTLQNLSSYSKLPLWGKKPKKPQTKNQALHGFDIRHTLRPDCISQMTTYQMLDVNWNIPFPKESLIQRLSPAMQNSTPVPTQALSVEGKDTEHTYLLLYSFYPGCEEGKLLARAAQATLLS